MQLCTWLGCSWIWQRILKGINSPSQFANINMHTFKVSIANFICRLWCFRIISKDLSIEQITVVHSICCSYLPYAAEVTVYSWLQDIVIGSLWALHLHTGYCLQRSTASLIKDKSDSVNLFDDAKMSNTITSVYKCMSTTIKVDWYNVN